MTESQLPTSNNPSPLIRLRKLMVDAFTLEDIRTLCFDLHVNFDELPHPGLTPKIRSLIQLMIGNGRLPDLVTAVTHTRPHVNWPALAKLTNRLHLVAVIFARSPDYPPMSMFRRLFPIGHVVK